MCDAELTSISMYFKLPRASSAWNDFKNWMHLSVARNGKTSQRSRFNLMCFEEGTTHLFQLCSRDSPSVSRLRRCLRRRDGSPLHHPEFVHRRLKILVRALKISRKNLQINLVRGLNPHQIVAEVRSWDPLIVLKPGEVSLCGALLPARTTVQLRQ